MKTITIAYECSECSQVFDIELQPLIPAKLYGPPERCYPAEGGEFEPDQCPNCGQNVNEATLFDQVDGEIEAARENDAEARAELRKEQLERLIDSHKNN